MIPGDVTFIPDYIEAPSLDELRRGMLSNNVKYGAQFNYFSIQKDGKRWVAFFYRKLDLTGENALGDKPKPRRSREG